MSLNKAKMLQLFPFILVAYEITNYLANDMYLPALPHIVTALNTSAHYAQQTLTTWFLGTTVLQLFLGPLSDRFGRRPIFFGGGLVFLVSTVFCALASNIKILLIARFFQGCSVGTIGTAGYASIHESYDSIRAMQILAIMGSITVLAPSFGPLVGGIILQWLSWRWIFGILVIWGIATLGLLWFYMPESNPESNRHPLNWKLIANNYLNIVKNTRFISNMMIFGLPFLGLIAWIAAGPFLVMTKFKFNILWFGIFQALIFGNLVIGGWVVNRIIDRIGVKRVIEIGLLFILCGGVLAFIFAIIFSHSIIWLILSLMIFSFGSALLFSPTNRMAIEACSEPMGARTAVFSTLMSLFGVIGGLLVSFTYTGTLFWFGVLLMILAILTGTTRILFKWS